MKIILLVLFSVIVSNANSQNFLRDKYNTYFPNNKSIQLTKLQREKDSLIKANDSLQVAQAIALDRINLMKKELVNLKADLFSHQENLKSTFIELEITLNVQHFSLYKSFQEVNLCDKCQNLCLRNGQQNQILYLLCQSHKSCR